MLLPENKYIRYAVRAFMLLLQEVLNVGFINTLIMTNEAKAFLSTIQGLTAAKEVSQIEVNNNQRK